METQLNQETGITALGTDAEVPPSIAIEEIDQGFPSTSILSWFPCPATAFPISSSITDLFSGEYMGPFLSYHSESISKIVLPCFADFGNKTWNSFCPPEGASPTFREKRLFSGYFLIER